MGESQDRFKQNIILVLYLLKAGGIILLCNFLALLILRVVQKYLPQIVKEKDVGAWEIFFSVFGVAYAIIVGLLIVEALRRYHALHSIIEQELNAVEDIRDFLVYVDRNNKVKEGIKESLLKYINKVTKKEWGKMRKNPKELESDTSDELVHIMEAIHKIKVKNPSDIIALESIIKEVAEVTTYRTERINLSDEHVSLPLRLLIIFMSVVIVCGFILMKVVSPSIHLLMIFANVTAVTSLYLVISDLNRPFGGFWDIEASSFEKVAKKLENEKALKKKGKQINDLAAEC